MKRMTAILLAGLFLLTGCQAKSAPLEAAQKNTEQIIEAAAIPNAEAIAANSDVRSLGERIGAPEQLQWSFTSEDGACTIHIDAPVNVPDADMPIVRVRPAQFTQEQVTKAFQAFCGDTPMFQMAAEGEERVRTEGGLQKLQMPLNGVEPVFYMGVEAESENHKLLFQVRNDADNVETVVSLNEDGTGGNIYGVQRGASMFCVNYDAVFYGGECSAPQNRVYRGDAIPQTARAYIELTPDAAYDIAEKWLADIGVSDSFAVADIYLERADMGGGTTEPVYYYGVECVRMVGGIPCAYLSNYSASTCGITELEGAYQSWNYERLKLTITNQGLAIAHWSGPIDIGETLSENAYLKPFAEIEEIAKKTLPIIYEKRTLPEWVNGTEVQINRVTLSLQRIVDQTQFDSGLLIPVWNFYGMWTDSRIGNETDAQSGTMLSINAIDGSVIDAAQGY